MSNEDKDRLSDDDLDQSMTDAERVDELWKNRNAQVSQREGQENRIAQDVPSQHLGTTVQQSSEADSASVYRVGSDQAEDRSDENGRERNRDARSEEQDPSFDRTESVATEGGDPPAEDGERQIDGGARAGTTDADAVFSAISGQPPSPADGGPETGVTEEAIVAAGGPAAAVDGQDVAVDGSRDRSAEAPDSRAGVEDDQGGIGIGIDLPIDVDLPDLPVDLEPVLNLAPEDLLMTGGSVLENALAGTVVGRVTGVDPDAGDVLTYALADDAGGLFAIDAGTGEIRVADGAVLDLETLGSAQGIVVTVTDAGGLSYREGFAIELGNVNEGPVDLALTGGEVLENALAGTVVGQVTGVDPTPATF